MFISERTKVAVRDYLSRPGIEDTLAQDDSQTVLRDALRTAKEFAEQRRAGNDVSAALTSQRVSI